MDHAPSSVVLDLKFEPDAVKDTETSNPSCWLIAKAALEDNNDFDAGAPNAQKRAAHKKSVGGIEEEAAGQFTDALCMRPIGAHHG
ncbi:MULTISPECIES: hypothetical protein [unclassified Mesorhizobium]|uniref:hypothetical protein n=1 Tax=unclassified Mesorhizobium TaxID=325217 RepID=UPI001FE051CA|nr:MULTISPECIES: hypothetical protein [unclassified Mesorhizobium]